MAYRGFDRASVITGQFLRLGFYGLFNLVMCDQDGLGDTRGINNYWMHHHDLFAAIMWFALNDLCVTSVYLDQLIFSEVVIEMGIYDFS